MYIYTCIYIYMCSAWDDNSPPLDLGGMVRGCRRELAGGWLVWPKMIGVGMGRDVRFNGGYGSYIYIYIYIYIYALMK